MNKGGDPGLIVAAVRTVAQGRKYVTPEIAQMFVESLTTPMGEMAHEKLSDRELQTLVLIASGKRLSDIAEELMLSPKTVSVYSRTRAGETGAGQQFGADGVRHPQRLGRKLTTTCPPGALARLANAAPAGQFHLQVRPSGATLRAIEGLGLGQPLQLLRLLRGRLRGKGQQQTFHRMRVVDQRLGIAGVDGLAQGIHLPR